MTRTNSEVAGNAEALVESTRQTIEVSKRLCHQSVELCCDLNAILTRLQESRAIHQNAIATAKQGSDPDPRVLSRCRWRLGGFPARHGPR